MTKYAIYIHLSMVLFGFSVVAQSGDSRERSKGRAPFADTQELNSSDYLAAIDRANDVMNNVREQGEFQRNILYVFNEITQTNTEINLITRNIKETANTNLRNQRMYEKLLLELRDELKKYQLALDAETDK